MAEREEIEKHTLATEGWNHEEGFRVPMITVTEDSRVSAGAAWLRGLIRLNQDWIHDDDIQLTDDFHKVLPGLAPLLVPIGELNPDPNNVRLHDERNLRAVRNSLSTFGQHHPVVVQKQGMVVRVGNARLDAAMSLGWTHLAALIVDEGDVEATARAIADNKTGELAVWDYEGLSGQLSTLADLDFDLELVGFENFESSPLLGASWAPPEPEDDGLEAPPRPAADSDPDELVRLELTQEQHGALLKAYNASCDGSQGLAEWIVQIAVQTASCEYP